MKWKRISEDRLRSGVYEIRRETVFGELTYFPACGPELLSVCHDADTAKAICERHSKQAG